MNENHTPRDQHATPRDEPDTPRDDDVPLGSGQSAWQTLGAALLVGAMAGAAWFAIRTPSERPPVTAAVTAVTAPATAAAREADIAAIMKVDAPVAAPTKPLPVAAGHTRVCGQDVANAAMADEQIARTLFDAGAAAALTGFAQQQLGDSDHARAVGLVLRMQADAHYGDPASGLGACNALDNDKSGDCFRREMAAHAQRVMPLVTALATLADASTDPRVMVLAREQCHAMASQGTAVAHCAPLSARRVVALERDNAAAWLALAAEEPGATDEALYQAALARRWDDHALAALRFIDRVDAKGGLRSMVLVQSLLMVNPGRSIEAQQVVLNQCTPQRVAADANRHQLCGQLALALRERANSVMGLSLAATLAERLGLVQAPTWRDEARLLVAVSSMQPSDPEARARDAQECSVGLPRDLLLQAAREGEVPALRAMMQASGQNEAAWRGRIAAFEQETLAQAKAMQAAPAASSAANDAAAGWTFTPVRR